MTLVAQSFGWLGGGRDSRACAHAHAHARAHAGVAALAFVNKSVERVHVQCDALPSEK